MARPRKPPSAAAQAAAANRQAANAAARNASVYWQQQARKKKPPAPGSTAPSDPSGPTSYADPTATPGGISVNGVAPVVPGMYDVWLQSYQPYQNALNATTADRATQIAQGAKGIADALAMWGGDLSSFQNALTGSLSGLQNGSQFLNALDWNAIQNAASQANDGGVSILAQLQKAQADRQGALESDLANRGIFWSGQNTAGTTANETQRAQDQYTQQRQLMDYLTGITSGYQQAENQRAANINTAATGAYDYYNDPNNQIPGAAGMQGAVGAGDPTAPPPPAAPVAPPPGSPAANALARRQEAYRRKRAAAQAAAARARAAAQRRAG